MRKCCNLAHKDLNDLLWSVDKTVRDVLDSQELKNLGSEIKDSLSRAGEDIFDSFSGSRPPRNPGQRSGPYSQHRQPPPGGYRQDQAPPPPPPGSARGAWKTRGGPRATAASGTGRTAGPRATAGRPGPGMPRPKAPTAARLWAANPAGSGAAQWQRRGSAFSAPSAGL